MIGRSSWLLVILLLFSIWIGKVASLSTTTIRVCQNKHCCKRNPNLLQTISNLVDNNKEVVVESSGCLSHCETGPNVEIILDSSSSSSIGGNSKVLNEMVDVATAAVQLELSGCLQSKSIPKLLIAASNVMERAATTQDPKEQERLLTSVISKIQEPYAQSTALAHAYALRARAYYDWESSQWPLAISDAQRATELLTVATPATISIAYRTWVDAEPQASNKIAVLQQWHRAQPAYRTKLQNEIQELRNQNE